MWKSWIVIFRFALEFRENGKIFPRENFDKGFFQSYKIYFHTRQKILVITDRARDFIDSRFFFFPNPAKKGTFRR